MGFNNIIPATREEAVAESNITDPTTLSQQQAVDTGTVIPNDINTAQNNPSVLNNSVLANQAQQATSGANRVAEAAGVSKYINQDYVAPDLTNEDFFPGKNMPIRVGGYTGKTIGSVDFFAPTGQYMPYSLIAKREAALDKAKAARKARQSTYKDPTTPNVVSPKYNENFQRAYLEGVNTVKDKAKAQYGDYAIDALQDPTSDVYREMQKHQADYNYLGAKSNELINNASSILSEVQTGNTTNHSEKTIEAARNLLNTEQYGYDVNKMVENGKKLEGYYSVDKYLNEDKYFTALKAQIDTDIADNGGYISTTARSNYTEQADLMAKQLKRTKYAGSPEVTEQDIKDAIFARVPQMGQSKETVKMKTVPASTVKQELAKDAALQRAKDVDAVTFNPLDERGNVTEAAKNVFGRIKNKSTDYGTIQNAEIQKADKFNALKAFNKAIIETVNNNINNKEGFEDFTLSTDKLIKNSEEKYGLTLTKAKMSFDKENPGIVRVYDANNKDRYKDVDVNDANAIQDALIEYNYGKEAVESKGKDVIKVDYLDANKRTQTRYLNLKDPGTASEINGYLNEGTSEDQKIADPMVQTEAQGANLLHYGKKTVTSKTEPKASVPARTEKINTIINQNPEAYDAWLKYYKGDKAKARQAMLDNAK